MPMHYGRKSRESEAFSLPDEERVEDHGVHYRMTTSPEALVMGALRDLRAAREALKLAGARRSADRVRLAISSTLGALRHARHAEARAERRARRTQEGGAR